MSVLVTVYVDVFFKIFISLMVFVAVAGVITLEKLLRKVEVAQGYI